MHPSMAERWKRKTDIRKKREAKALFKKKANREFDKERFQTNGNSTDVNGFVFCVVELFQPR